LTFNGLTTQVPTQYILYLVFNQRPRDTGQHYPILFTPHV